MVFLGLSIPKLCLLILRQSTMAMENLPCTDAFPLKALNLR